MLVAEQSITDKLVQEKAYVSLTMRGLLRKAMNVEDEFRQKMDESGGVMLKNRPNSYAFSKFNTGPKESS